MILLVEDYPPALELLTNSLQDYEPVGLTNGQDALSWVQDNLHQPPSLVISDYSLPGMNGVRLLHAVRRLSPTTKIVLMSGTIREELEPLCRECKFDAWLGKPFTTSQVRTLVHDLLFMSGSTPGNLSGSTTIGR